MSKYIRNLSIVITIIVGIISALSVGYLSMKQKNNQILQKSFEFNLNEIKRLKLELKFKILETYIYGYNDNDYISNLLNSLETDIDKLSNNKILNRQNYAPLKNYIKVLKDDTKQNIQRTYYFLMLNAAVKNSLIFLTTLTDTASDKLSLEIYKQADTIIKKYLFGRRFKDLSYLSNTTINVNFSLNKAEKDFINRFNRHSKFLSKKFPELIYTSNNIITNTQLKRIDKLYKRYSKIAKNDVEFIEKLSIVIFSILIIAFLFLIYILVKYKKEHTQLQLLSNSLKYSLTHDNITKLKNREALTNEIKDIKNASIIVINIDRFKDINDIYGNEIGNHTLKKVAIRLKNIATAFVEFVDIYRIGGDEFCLLFSNVKDEIVYNYAKKIEKEIEHNEFIVKNISLHISISLSVNSKKPLIENADLALKHIKKDKIKKIILYKDNLNLKADILENLRIMDIVKKAIKEDKVIPYFQPIINIKTNKIIKYEALVRIINHKEVLLPYQFLDIVKKTPYYYEITKIMVEKTLKEAKKHPAIRFSINFSMKDIENPYITKILFDIFDKNKQTASRIDIELLESEFLSDTKAVADFIEKVHSYGSLVLIDDFGSGYSNFAYFSDFKIDIVKIDGSIINEIATDDRKKHMLESIAKFCKGMDMEIIAEFVDNENILDILKSIDIEYAQGYLFSPPVKKPFKKTDIKEISPIS